MYPAVVSPFLAGLDGLLRSVLSSRCAPIGILGVIAVPRQFHVRLSEALLHRAAWLGHARPEKTFDGLYEHLARLAALIREEDDLLSGFIRELADEFILRRKGEASLDVRTLSLVPPALARRVAREFIRELKGDLRAVSFDDIESVLGLKEGKGMTVKKGLALRREAGRLVRVRRAPVPRAFEKSWDGRGEFKAGGVTFRGKTADRPADKR